MRAMSQSQLILLSRGPMLGLFSPEADPQPPSFYLADPNGNTCWHLTNNPQLSNAHTRSTHDQQPFFISCSVAQFERPMILSLLLAFLLGRP